MKKLTYLCCFAVLLCACEEEEPFEFPDEPIDLEERIITHAERRIVAGQDSAWTDFSLSSDCPRLDGNTAFLEFSTSRNAYELQAAPSAVSCVIDLNVRTEFAPEELSEKNWNELTFEFFLSEYIGNSATECILSLHYNELALDFDLAPYIEDIGLGGGNDGTLKIGTDLDGFYIEFNGVKINENFSEESGNTLDLNAAGDENFFKLSIHSENTVSQSVAVFRYLRIYSVES